jgi:hypothetical protein
MTERILTSLAVVFLVAIELGAFGTRVAVAAGEPRITDAVLGQDRRQLPTSYEIVNPTTVFRPDSPRIACVFKIEGAGIGTRVKSVWIAEDVGAKAPPNYKIDEKSLALPFINSGSFTLSKPNKGWPVGSYRLEVYIGSTLAKTVKFTVKAK